MNEGDISEAVEGTEITDLTRAVSFYLFTSFQMSWCFIYPHSHIEYITTYLLSYHFSNEFFNPVSPTIFNLFHLVRFFYLVVVFFFFLAYLCFSPLCLQSFNTLILALVLNIFKCFLVHLNDFNCFDTLLITLKFVEL